MLSIYMDIMLQTQMEGKNINLFIENHYEVFWNNIIKEYSSEISKSYKVINYIQKYICVFMILCLIMEIGNRWNGNSIDIGITVSQIIFINIILVFLMPILKISKQGMVNIYPMYLPS